MSKVKVALGLSGGVDPDNSLTGSRGLHPRVARARLWGKRRVAVGLSGGVDSAVSAYLLKKQGYDVSCVYLNCYDGDTPGCRGDNDRKDALAVAMHLGLPFRVLDFKKAYQAAVIDYFKKEYLAGRTPNPDVVCNRDIKFGLFMDWSIKHRYDYIATGHYAKLVATPAVNSPLPWSTSTRRGVVTAGQAGHYAKLDGRGWKIEDGGGRLKMEDGKVKVDRSTLYSLSSTTIIHHPSSIVHLVRPADLHKDQTYFLWAVPAEKFRRVLFPLGDLLKTEVRQIALKIGLPVAKKKDSTGICFVGEVRVEDFLKKLGVREKRGEVVIRSVIGSPLSVIGSRSIGNQSVGFESINRKLANQNLKTDNRKPTTEDIVIGSHRGVWFYTIGQRHGFSVEPKNKTKGEGTRDKGKQVFTLSPQPLALSPSYDRPPLYVIEKDIKKNRLIVGFGAETYRDQFVVSDTNWLVSKKARPSVGRPGLNKFTCLVRVRHGGELIPCSVIGSQFSAISPKSIGYPPAGAWSASDWRAGQSAGLKPTNRKQVNQNPTTDNRKRITISLSIPQRGIAPGQSAVFYLKDGTVLGGGVIQ